MSLLVALLVLWLLMALAGLIFKALAWLTWVAIVLVAVTLVAGFVAGLFTRS